jgi:hypothetical protein
MTLSEIAEGPHGHVSNHHALTEALLRRLNEKGLTLEQCADRRLMDRSLRTLQAYAREFELSFPDYTPLKLRPKKSAA